MSIRGLAIETSGSVGSVALIEAGKVAATDTFAHGLQHAARIIPVIDGLCVGLGWRPADIREIYVSTGPGSFTGLRIGITLAKTLAFATGARVVAVSTVAVLAQNAPPDARHLIVVLDAKRGQIFTARFEKVIVPSHLAFSPSPCTQGEGWCEGPFLMPNARCQVPNNPHPNPPPEYRGRGKAENHAMGSCPIWCVRQDAHLSTLAQMLADSPRPVYLLGEGLAYHLDEIPGDDPAVIATDRDTWQADAAAVARLGYAAARRGEFIHALQLAPRYIRLPEAQEKWEAAHALRKDVPGNSSR